MGGRVGSLWRVKYVFALGSSYSGSELNIETRQFGDDNYGCKNNDSSGVVNDEISQKYVLVISLFIKLFILLVFFNQRIDQWIVWSFVY